MKNKKAKRQKTCTEMYDKLCKKLSRQPGGVDQYVDLCSIASRLGFKITKIFRGKDYVTDKVSGRFEVWIEVPGWNSKAGKGDSLGIAVKDAVSNCYHVNSTLSLEVSQ